MSNHRQPEYQKSRNPQKGGIDNRRLQSSVVNMFKPDMVQKPSPRSKIQKTITGNVFSHQVEPVSCSDKYGQHRRNGKR